MKRRAEKKLWARASRWIRMRRKRTRGDHRRWSWRGAEANNPNPWTVRREGDGQYLVTFRATPNEGTDP